MQIVNLVYHQTAGASQCLKRSFGCKSVTPLKKADANPLNLVNLATRRKSLILFRTQRCIHTYLCIYVYLCVIGQPIAKQQLFLLSASASDCTQWMCCNELSGHASLHKLITIPSLCTIVRAKDYGFRIVNSPLVANATRPMRQRNGNIACSSAQCSL